MFEDMDEWLHLESELLALDEVEDSVAHDLEPVLAEPAHCSPDIEYQARHFRMSRGQEKEDGVDDLFF